MRRILAILLATLAGLVLLLLVALQTPWARNYLRGLAERQAEAATGADVSIGALRGSLLTGAELQNVYVSHAGRPVITVPEIDVSYSILDVVSGAVDISSIALQEPVIHIRRTDSGQINLAALGGAGRSAADRLAREPVAGRMPTPQSTRGSTPVPPVEGLFGEARPAAKSGRSWSIGDLVIRDGTLTVGDDVVAADSVTVPERLGDLDGDFGLRSRPGGGVVVGIDALSFQTVAPELRVQSVEGEVVIAADTLRFDELAIETSAGAIRLDGSIRDRQTTPVYDLRVATRDLELAEFARIVAPLEGYALSPTIEATFKGPANALQANVDVQTSAGAITGDVMLDTVAPQRAVAGTVRTRSLNLAALRLAEEPTVLTMDAKIDLRIPESGLAGVNGTYVVTAPRFEYGQYDAQDLEAAGKIKGRTVEVNAEARIYGGTVHANGTITLPSEGRPIRYDLDGRLRAVDPSQLKQDIKPPGVAGRRLRTAGQSLNQESSGGGIGLDFSVRGRGAEIEAEAQLLDVSLAGADFSDGTTVQVSRTGGRLQYSAEGGVTGLDLRRLGRELGLQALRTERFASEINARFDISGSGSDLETLSLEGTATLNDSSVFGMRLPRMVVEPDLTRGAGTVNVDGRFERVDLGELTGKSSLESSLQGSVDARVTVNSLANPDFSPGALNATGRLTLVDSSISNVAIDDAVVDASVSEAIARIDELSIRGKDLTVEASGTLALDAAGSSNLRYLIDTPALQRFEQLGVPARGDVLLEGRLTGNLGELAIDGTLSGTDVGYGTTTALSVHSEYDVIIPDLAPAQATVAAVTELTKLEAAGRSFSAVKARTDYAARTLEFDTTVADAGRTIDAEGRLLLHADHQEVHLRRLTLETPDATWTLAAKDEAVVNWSGGRVAISDFVLTSGAGGRIAVAGALGAPERALTASINGLRLESIDDLILEKQPLAGTVNATATMQGTFAAPRVDAEVAVTDGGYRDFAFQFAGGTMQYSQARLQLDARIEAAGAGLTATGSIPLAASGGKPMNVAVRSTPIDLALVQTFTDELRDVSGTAEVDLHVTGTLADPRAEGSVRVRNGAFMIALAQSRYTGFDTDVTFDPDRITVREFHLVDDEGNRLRVGGQMALNGTQVGAVDLRVHSEQFELTDNRLAELNADTDIRVSGELLRPRITGLIGLRESLVRVDRILEVVEGPRKMAAAEDAPAAGEPGAFAPTLAITVSIPETLVLRGTDLQAPGGGPVGLGDMNITIGGELDIRKQPGEDVTIAGELHTIRGSYEFQGREFAIQRDGRIVFMGGNELNPRLDIRAQREISGVTASVHIGGVLDAPQLELSSQPPMEDAEILSLIVFNQPLSLLGTGAQISLATRATALATGFVASALTESLGEALELDLLEIEASTAAGVVAPELTVGEQFGDLFVKLRQRFGPQAVSEAILEYRLAEWLRLETSYAQADATARNLLQRIESGGISLVFFFSY